MSPYLRARAKGGRVPHTRIYAHMLALGEGGGGHSSLSLSLFPSPSSLPTLSPEVERNRVDDDEPSAARLDVLGKGADGTNLLRQVVHPHVMYAFEERARVESLGHRELALRVVARRRVPEVLHEALGHLERALGHEGALRVDVHDSALESVEGCRDPSVQRELHRELRLADARHAGKLGEAAERHAAAEELVELGHERDDTLGAALLMEQLERRARWSAHRTGAEASAAHLDQEPCRRVHRDAEVLGELARRQAVEVVGCAEARLSELRERGRRERER